MTVAGGTDVLLHVQSPEPDALPLIITHGWPGSIVEFLDVIHPLADPRAHGGDPADAFHLVIPSIPGFGPAGPTRAAGWDVPRIARAWAELMRRLYYETFHPTTPPRSGPWTVPTGVAVFAGDLARPVRILAERDNNIVHWSEFDRGEHFAAMEEPDLFVTDVRDFARRLR